MKRVSVDTASPAVKNFIRSLALDADGGKVIPPAQLSDSEKAAQLADLRKLLAEARSNSNRLPAKVVERNIRDALVTVRGSR